MSNFLDACRQEWQRLGVPGPVADEMAADLAADLEQADAEGVPAEELLGSALFDPNGFAATWAAERGVVPPTSPRRPGHRWPILVTVACFAVLAILGGAIAAIAFHGATLVGVVHGASPGLAGLAPHGFVRHVGPPEAGLQPLAMSLVIVGLLGVAVTVASWYWRSRSHRGGGPLGGFGR